MEPGRIPLEPRSLLSVTFNATIVTSNPNLYPASITSGPGGDLWFTLRCNSGSPRTQIGSINPTTNEVNIIPLTQSQGQGDLGAITTDASGDLWFLDFPLVEEYNPSTGAFHEQALPNKGPFVYGTGLVFGPNQSIWVANLLMGQLDEVNPQTLAVTPFTTPDGLDPDGLAVGPDGALWFTTGSPTIGRFDPTTSQFQTFTTSNSASTTNRIVAGPDNRLYFTDGGALSIGIITPDGSASTISEFPLPVQGLGIVFGTLPISGLTVGADGNIWFALNGRSSGVGSFNPSTDAANYFVDPNPSGGNPKGIALGPDGNLWFTSESASINGPPVYVVQVVTSGGSGGGSAGGSGSGSAPTILGVQPFVQTTSTGKGKHARHESQLAGFTLTFNEALDLARAGSAANYAVLVKVKHGRKTSTLRISVSVDYTAGSDEVTVLTGKQTFAHGGELTVNGSAPGGISDPTDTFFLTGTTTFTISPKGRSIGP